MIYIYNLFFYLILPFLPLRLLWKARKNPAYFKHLPERFAYFKNLNLSESIWIHAVSVGESLATIPLIKLLKQQYPNTPLIVTTMTPTGAECIQKTLGNEVLQLYIPYDYPQAVKRFLRHIKPKILIIIETELWPNILHYCAKNKIPVLLANARLSAKSFQGYKKIANLTKYMLNCLQLILTQSEQDRERFLKLGAISKRVISNGNVKFDIQIPENIQSTAKTLRNKWGAANRPIWVAASTHEGEEKIILNSFEKILQQLPNTLLILAPRHPERFNKIAQLCIAKGLQIAHFSRNEKVTNKTKVILGDVMGQLLLFYAASDVAFVGGSFVDIGGHNILEPAALNIPIITGPKLHNFKEISELLLKANAMLKLDTESELTAAAIKLLSNSELQAKYAGAAQQVVMQNKGATQRIFDKITKMLQ